MTVQKLLGRPVGESRARHWTREDVRREWGALMKEFAPVIEQEARARREALRQEALGG